ncbi:MAG: hypothetical protein V1882_00530 [Candidatus Omnitrophota bacterium]
MKKILILEKPAADLRSHYDEVFSFCENPAHTFPENYLGHDEVDALYLKVYTEVCSQLSRELPGVPIVYKEVRLLWCFKKELFSFLYWTVLKWEIVRRVFLKNPGAVFYIELGNGNLDAARVGDILKLGSVAKLPTIEWLRTDARIEERDARHVRRYGASIWPKTLSFLRSEKVHCAFFSDPARSESVIQNLHPARCVIYSNAAAPRMLLRSLRNGASFFQSVVSRKSQKKYRELIRKLTDALSQQRLFLDVVLGGLSMQSFVDWKMPRFFEELLPHLLSDIDAMECFFKKVPNLRSALMDEDVDPCKNAFAQLARIHRVKTFVELHGAIGAPHGLIPLTADQMFVWGKAQKEKLIRWGCPADRIVTSGCSRYEHYQKLDYVKVRREVCQDLKLDPAKKVVLLVFMPLSRWSAWYESRVRRMIAEMLNAARELSERSDVQFVIKLHPAETKESYYRDWIALNQLTGRAVVVRRYDPLLLGKAVDLLIVYGSTYSVDGFALDKPVICVDDKWNPLLEEFRPYKVFLYADTREQIVSMADHILREGFSRPPLWERAKQECLNQDGEAPAAFIAEQLSHV